MRALVTGSSGFLGRHIVAGLHDVGWAVRELDPAAGARAYGDCRPFFRHTAERFDLLVHCAAIVGGREGIDFNAANLMVSNLEMDALMFDYALRTKPGRVVYFSSAAAYPVALQTAKLHVRLREQDRGETGAPDEGYGWVKWTGERVVREVSRAGVPVTIVRPFSTYGPDQDECYPFRAMLDRARGQDNPFVVWGDGSQVRDWIHVDDLVAALLALVEHGVAGPVNLGTGTGTSMDELAELMMASAGYEAPIKHLLNKPVGVERRVANNALLRRYYKPRVTLAEGVERAMQ